MTVLTQPAYAKLNLTLDILGSRPDGYHELEMVMHAVDLHDDVTVTVNTGAPWTITCTDGAGQAIADLPQSPKNLAWKAAACYLEQTGMRVDGLAIHMVKRIPAQAGMAGGSADAAAVLLALNRHFGDRLPVEDLCRVAEQVGSDVPFCVFGGTALVGGRGERLQRVDGIPALHFVVCKPDFGISTPALFAAYDAWHDDYAPDAAALLDALRADAYETAGSLLCNVLEPVAQRQHPELETIRQALLACGACGARMTGSGSAVFGLFRDGQSAETAAKQLKQQNLGQIFCTCSA